MTTLHLALASLLPLVLGPLPVEGRTLEARLCNGGSVSIPIEPNDEPIPELCLQKGCHAGCNRKRFDLAQ